MFSFLYHSIITFVVMVLSSLSSRQPTLSDASASLFSPVGRRSGRSLNPTPALLEHWSEIMDSSDTRSLKHTPLPSATEGTSWRRKKHNATQLEDEAQPFNSPALDRFRHQCPHCSYNSSTETLLTIHIRTHTGETPYHCQLCTYKTRNNTCLKNHMRTHAFQCPHCSFSTGSNAFLLDHFGICLKSHELTSAAELPYGCPLCPFKAATIHAFEKHIQVHSVLFFFTLPEFCLCLNASLMLYF